MTAAHEVSTGATAVESVSPATSATPWRNSRFWRRGGFLFAGAAQVITISALVTPDRPLAATWASLLLAIAPVLLAAAGAYLRSGTARLAAVAAAAVVILIGMIGAIHQAGALFIPAFVMLVVAAVLQLRELH
jgi:hypothetical protein